MRLSPPVRLVALLALLTLGVALAWRGLPEAGAPVEPGSEPVAADPRPGALPAPTRAGPDAAPAEDVRFATDAGERIESRADLPIDVVYRSTGEGVPYAALLVRAPGREERFHYADERGRLELPAEEVAARLEVGLVDDETDEVEDVRVWWPVELLDGGRRGRVVVRTWPTLQFDLVGLSDCQGHARGEESPLDLELDDSFSGDAERMFDGPSSPYLWRESDGEFSEAGLAHMLAYGEALPMTLRCDECEEGAYVRQRFEEGHFVRRERVALRSLGSITVLVDPSDAAYLRAVGSRCGLGIRRPADVGTEWDWFQTASFDDRSLYNEDDDNSSVTLRWLVADRYDLEVWRGQQALWRTTLDLLPGEDRVLSADLDCPPRGRILVVRLNSRTGTYHCGSHAAFWVESADGAWFERVEADWWRDGDSGAWIAGARFPGLRPGSYVVGVDIEDRDLLETRTQRIELEAVPAVASPFAFVDTFWIDDTAPRSSCSFRVRQAGSESPIDGAIVVARVPDGPVRSEVTERGRCTLEHLPPAVPFEWVVRAPGFLPARARHGGLSNPEVDEVVVDLVPGWSAELEVLVENRAQESWEPLPHVEVFTGDEFLGITDAEGLVTLTRDAAPSRLRLHRPGYRVQRWYLDDLVEPDPNEERLFFLMQPVPR